jgi:uncharacterized protein YqeY
VRKEILRVAVGEITTNEARGTVKTEDDERAIVRKLMKSNEETLSLTTDEAQKQVLMQEIAILRELLPQSLGVDAIVEALAPVRDALRAEANDGKATGAAMKHLKSLGALVEGKDVSEAVRRVRA